MFAMSQRDLEWLTGFCRRWNIAELALFGSALREDFRPDSDLDLLVTFMPEAEWGLLDQVEMQEEARLHFGRPVDLVSRKAIEGSANPIRKQQILQTAEVVYAAQRRLS
jgi:predicted nucleotidyltransferase